MQNTLPRGGVPGLRSLTAWLSVPHPRHRSAGRGPVLGPGAGSTEADAAYAELRLAAALRDADPVARAAYALLVLEGLTNRQAETVLAQAGVVNHRNGVAAGQRMALIHPAEVASSSEFDPCTLRTGPVDLPRRRRRRPSARS
ncbi:hypothetical protein ABH926_003487 [Catenulispora sp. GP43]|uniref:hypothetical protein n=1 Tax=Catenulispora sp. GP43 TaxID=3156263 RepID=UPI00351863DA